MKDPEFEGIRYNTGQHYTTEVNTLILLSLLKKNNIKRVVVSPGATNFAIVGSMQHDPYFELYSCVDERAAAYMALGIAARTSEPVVLSCTGATASRNYMAALTEAFMRNIPILVVTSSLGLDRVGHLKAQVTDRAHAPKDVVIKQYQIDNLHEGEEDACALKINEALAFLRKFKKPVHINNCTTYCLNFSVKNLPDARYIPLISDTRSMPELPKGRIGIFVGSHRDFTDEESSIIDRFCESNDAVVFADHASGYYGKYRVQMSLPFYQRQAHSNNSEIALLIHIGEISGDYHTFTNIQIDEVWRVNEDGAFRDFWGKLTKVFDLPETDFFSHYISECVKHTTYLDSCMADYKRVTDLIPEIPLSNIWVAKTLSTELPNNTVLHLGILNSLRAWNMFKLPNGVRSYSNVGGFGIDGCVSSLLGAALVNPDKLYLGVVGDLATFYDINVFMHKRIPSNLRLIVINNGRGVEFRNYDHPANRVFGDSVDAYIAAAGHNGNQSRTLLETVALNNGFNYVGVNDKEQFNDLYASLLDSSSTKPIIMEVFTDPNDESDALKLMAYLYRDSVYIRNQKIKIMKHRLRSLVPWLYRKIINK